MQGLLSLSRLSSHCFQHTAVVASYLLPKPSEAKLKRPQIEIWADDAETFAATACLKDST